MTELRKNGPYIWVTWLNDLIVGNKSCEWSSWFKAQHDSGSWEKVPSSFDAVGWQVKHTNAINKYRLLLEKQGFTTSTESQNDFTLRGKLATLGGKPDLIVKRGKESIIIDVKTGKPDSAHSIQVMLYMYAIPKALTRYQGVSFDGRVVYKDHEVNIPASSIDETFISNISSLIRRIASETPARRVPSFKECRYCNISYVDCPERVEREESSEGTTEDF